MKILKTVVEVARKFNIEVVDDFFIERKGIQIAHGIEVTCVELNYPQGERRYIALPESVNSRS